MAAILTHPQATEAMGAFLFGGPAADLPDELREALTKAFNASSPVDRATNFAEVVYANRASFDKTGLSLGAELATFCASSNFGHLRDERGTLVCDTLRREAGETKPGRGKWHKAEADPENAPKVFVLETKTSEPETAEADANAEPASAD